MKADIFPTHVYTGHLDIPEKVISMYKSWRDFERELDPNGAQQSTTQNGWQYTFAFGENEPEWLQALSPAINQIKEEVEFVRTKTMWVVDYNKGGYQDPHFHSVGIVKVSTIIINLIGNGELVIQDPRQLAMGQGYGFAYEHKFKPGDWLAMPAYLIHNSRPCLDPRSILVLDVYVK